MESDQTLQLDRPMMVRREREWLYFKLKAKVDVCEMPHLGELKAVDCLFTEIESSMESSFSSSAQLRDLDDAALNELLEERRRSDCEIGQAR